MRKFSVLLILALALCSCTHRLHVNNVQDIVAAINNPSDKNVLVISHRGDWRNFPENSLEAFGSTIKLGVDIVEVDLKMTSDSVLIIMHDRDVDRTTSGKGPVSSITLDSMKTFFLKNGCGIVTPYKVPTLEEVLLLCKDRIVINLDQGYQYYPQVYKLTQKTGTTAQILIKGNAIPSKARENAARIPENAEKMMYMPIIDFRNNNAAELFEAYQKEMPVIAYEIVWDKMTPEVMACIDECLESGARVWTNSMWDSLCGGLSDDKALTDPERIYGEHIKLGATMIQTDRPELLIKYLRSKKLHR